MTNSDLPHPQECVLYHNLWTDRSWVHRRIDEISFTERGMMQVKSTFDLDIAYLKKKISRLPKKLRKGNQVALPLTALPRTLLLDIDVTLDGKAQSFASTETSADITRCIYVQEYYNEYVSIINSSNAQMQQEWPAKEIDEIAYVSDIMYKSFQQHGGKYLDEQKTYVLNNLKKCQNKLAILRREEETLDSTLKKNIKQSREELEDYIFKYKNKLKIQKRITPSHSDDSNLDSSNQAKNKWLRFKESDYIAVVLVDLPSDRKRAKLTYVTKTRPDYSDAPSILPIRFSPRRFTSPSLLGSGIEKRYHFRVNAPNGHYLSSINLTDVRNNNNEAFFQSNNPCPEEKETVKSITCETADGADLTFLEIKDKTVQGSGNIFGYTLNIGVEPFPQTFIFRALVSIFFLLFYMLFARFAAFESGRIVPFSIAALGFLASSPLWFRIGSEDAFTHRTLRRGRTILGGLSTAVFLLSFGTQLVRSGEIAKASPDGHKTSCVSLLNDHILVSRVIDDQFICGKYSRLFEVTKDASKSLEEIINHSWELVFLLCILYALGIFWFLTRTYFQKNVFKLFLSRLSSTPFNKSFRQVYLTTLSRVRLAAACALAILIFSTFAYVLLLAYQSLSVLINDVFQLLFDYSKDYLWHAWLIIGVIFFPYVAHHLLDPVLWKTVVNFTKRRYYKLPHPTKRLVFYDSLLLALVLISVIFTCYSIVVVFHSL